MCFDIMYENILIYDNVIYEYCVARPAFSRCLQRVDSSLAVLPRTDHIWSADPSTL